jgi:pimeloyl-CoA synthetase
MNLYQNNKDWGILNVEIVNEDFDRIDEIIKKSLDKELLRIGGKNNSLNIDIININTEIKTINDYPIQYITIIYKLIKKTFIR